MKAVHKSTAGQPSLSSEAAQVLLQKVNEPTQIGQDISSREKEILASMVEGLSNNEIADRVCISQSTFKFHLSNILSKLGASGRTEAVVLVVKLHLVDLSAGTGYFYRSKSL